MYYYIYIITYVPYIWGRSLVGGLGLGLARQKIVPYFKVHEWQCYSPPTQHIDQYSIGWFQK